MEKVYVNSSLAATLTDCSNIGQPGYIHLACNNTGGTAAGGQFFDSVEVVRDGVISEPATLGLITW